MNKLDEKNCTIYNDLLEITRADLPWGKLKNKKVLITGGAGFLYC